MTDETPIDDMENWTFPEKHLEKLEELDTGTPYYNLAQGSVYDTMRSDVRYTPQDAMDVSRALNNGDLEEAEEIIYGRLDGEEP